MVKGLKSLRRKLTKTIPEHVKRATRKSIAQGAKEIVRLARSLVPVDQGELRDSIGWTFGKAPADAVILAVSTPVNGIRATVYAGNSEAFYVRWIEFGAQNHPPHPFFYPSYRSLKRRVRSRVTRNIRKAIRKGAK